MKKYLPLFAIILAAVSVFFAACRHEEPPTVTVYVIRDGEVRDLYGISVADGTVIPSDFILDSADSIQPAEGYSFGGLYTDKACTAPYGGEDIAENAVLYLLEIKIGDEGNGSAAPDD